MKDDFLELLHDGAEPSTEQIARARQAVLSRHVRTRRRRSAIVLCFVAALMLGGGTIGYLAGSRGVPVTAAGPQTEPASEVWGHEWTVNSISGVDQVPPLGELGAPVKLTFERPNSVGWTVCNSYLVKVAIDDPKIRTLSKNETFVYCGPAMEEIERQLTTIFSEGPTIEIVDNRLTLRAGDMVVKMSR